MDSFEIPRHLTAYVGSDNDSDGRMYVLWREGHTLVIQAPALVSPENADFTADLAAYEKMLSDFNFDLEKIQTLLGTIDFGRSNWAYFRTRRTGGYELIYKRKTIHRISCPTWATLVDEQDITFTKWITCEDRQGIWNGMEVDVLMGWNDRWADVVDLEMRGHCSLQGLDLTYQVIGHVIRDSQVLGLMTEPAYGRMVEYSDKADVYDAISKVQNKGFLYTICPSNIMIHNGKVRLLGLSSVRKYAPNVEGFKKADIYHWDRLAAVFGELKGRRNFMVPLRSWIQRAIVLSSVPSPERPLLSNFSTRLLRLLIHCTAASLDISDVLRPSSEHRSSHRSRPRGSRARIPVLPRASTVESESSELCAVDETSDQPLISFHFPFRNAYRYNRPIRTRRLLISSNDSDQTSESGMSSLL